MIYDSSIQSRRTESGVALLTVLSSMIIMGMVIFAFVKFSETHLKEKADAGLRFRARLLAESGMALGLHPDIEPGEPALRQSFEEDTGFRVRITREAGRFPVNMADAGENYLKALTELFVVWGLPLDEANIVAESLADWVDTDSEARNSGAEEDFYAGYELDNFPTNSQFATVDEMLLCRGMDKVDRLKPNWREYFTTYGTGLIDLNAASVDVIRAALDVSIDEAQKLRGLRAGSDGVLDTEDDEYFENLEEVSDQLGINDAEWSEISAMLTVSDTLRRIESTGYVGEFEVKMILIADEGSDGSSGAVARFER